MPNIGNLETQEGFIDGVIDQAWVLEVKAQVALRCASCAAFVHHSEHLHEAIQVLVQRNHGSLPAPQLLFDTVRLEKLDTIRIRSLDFGPGHMMAHF